MGLRFFSKVVAGMWLSVMIATAATALTVTAKKDGVKVTKEASKSSDVLKTLKKGESLDALERKGLYWQVKVDGDATGFVSILKVKRGSAASGGIAEAIRAASEEGRADGDNIENTRTRSAVMGVRGLDESSETQYAGNAKPNLRLVYQMEDRRVPKKRVQKLESQVMKELEMVASRRGG